MTTIWIKGEEGGTEQIKLQEGEKLLFFKYLITIAHKDGSATCYPSHEVSQINVSKEDVSEVLEYDM